MPWLARAVVPDTLSFGSEGGTWWWTPASFTADGFHALTYPSGVRVVDARPSWVTYDDRLLETGGSDDNMVVTGDFKFWRQGIRAPTFKPTATLAGTGWTAALIVYAQWYDEESDEESPLSVESDTLNAANQAVTVTNANQTPPNDRVTHIRFWLSVDGGLPRLAATRQVGTGASVTLPSTIGELGEAFAEDFDNFPRCRFNVAWHDRQIMAGDDQNPNLIYISLIGLPERRALFSFETKTRQPVVGLAVVNDQLLVFTPFATERISGYTEDDLAIEIAQPNIGCVSHHGVVVAHNVAFIPTQLGFYASDASGWYFISAEIDSKYIAEFELRQSAYQDMWAIHDPVTRGYSAHVGNHSDMTALDVRWWADYKPTIPQATGSFGQPNWSYDTTGLRLTCGAVLALPGGRRQDVYFGSNAGFIYVQSSGVTSDDDSNYDWHFIGSGEYFGDCGGDLAHGKRITEATFYLRSEDNPWAGAIHAGDAEPYPQLTPSFETGTVPASAATIDVGGFTYTMQPKWTHRFPVPQCVGQAFQVEIVVTNPVAGLVFGGYDMDWVEGPYDRFPVTSEES